MKKIFDWTAGSFFRTIGRVIAFSLIGYLIAMLLQANDFKLSELFLIRAKADTLETAIWVTYYSDSAKTTQLPANSSYQYIALNANGNNIVAQSIYFSPEQLKTNKFEYIELPFMVTGKFYEKDNITDRECLRYMPVNCGSDVNGNYSCGYQCYNWSDTNVGNYTLPIDFSFNVSLVEQNGQNQAPCTVNEDKLRCYLQTGIKYDRFYIQYNLTGSNLVTPLLFNFSHVVGRYKDSQQQIIENQQQTNDAITNQTQQQQQQHQEIMDNNTTQAEDDATNFFEDFTVPDVGGLSAIITAPLSTIQSLLNSTCTNLILPLPFVNENLTLPCLTTIYTEHFGAFFTLYQTIILAIVAYRCIRSIFFDIHGFTDPSDDRIEVMDL